MTFFERVEALCAEKGVSPDKLCKDLGLSNATATKWRKGAEPRNATKKAVADYFKVSIEYITGESEQKESPSVTPTDERVRIAMEHINGLSSQELDALIPLLEQMRKANKGNG